MIKSWSRFALATAMGLVPLVASASALPASAGTRPSVETGIAGTAVEEPAEDVSVVELDLDGVSRSALPDLPEVAPIPEESQTASPGGAAALDVAAARTALTTAGDSPAAEPEPSTTTQTPEPTATPAPEATAEPTPEPTEEPAASPEPTTSPEPTPAPTPSAAVEPEPTPDVLTAELETAPFSVLGVTWEPAADLTDVVIRYRVRQDDRWSEWEAVGSSDIAPDANGKEAADAQTRGATDPIVAIDADGVQIWAEAATGRVTGLKAVLIDPGELPEDETLGAAGAGSGGSGISASALPTATGAGAPGMPAIIRRSQWGADESQVTCVPEHSTGMVSAAVHHTASTNGYSADAVPGLLRGFMTYHTRPEAQGGRGWCDIGYNFLVDTYGRVFEGRKGSIDMSVVGVHTGGFNSRTIGISAIGNFSSAAPTAPMLEAISRVIAWKFTQHRIFAGTTVQMVSGGGASRFPAGQVVTFPTIYGHRDAQQTSCPGELLYNHLGNIRSRVAQLANATSQATPFGDWEGQTIGKGSVTVNGWLIDPDTTSPITVAVTVDGRFHLATAGNPRNDVASVHPSYGPNHGYSVEVPVLNGRHSICVSALNVGGGEDRLIGCKWITASNPQPQGNVESITTTATSVTVKGWARDPDTSNPIDVHVYVDNGAKAGRADLPRPDLARYFSSTNHGYEVTVPATPGPHTVCVYGINVPAGNNPSLGCRTVTVVNQAPAGNLESLTVSGRSVTVTGWARDPDTTSPIAVHTYVDSSGWGSRADLPRPDLARYFGSTNHGYSATVPVNPGKHSVCVYAINAPAGSNPSTGCRTVTIPNATPVGMLDSVRVSGGRLQVSGWALDKDVTAPINVALYVNGRGYWNRADVSRPDIGRAFPGMGDAHGFALDVPAGPGRYEVCAVAVNDWAGTNANLGCRVVTG